MVIIVGVLALQGGFSLHQQILKKIGVESVFVKNSYDLNKVDGLVIPGGESTTISLLIKRFDMFNALIDFGKKNPIMGTCAGLIMMSSSVDDKRIKPLGLVNIAVERNAYGRQIESKTEIIQFRFTENHKLNLPTTFIRAPMIKNINDEVQVIGEYNDSPIAILSNHHLCLSFHPELNQIDIFHRILFDKRSDYYYKNINQYHAS